MQVVPDAPGFEIAAPLSHMLGPDDNLTASVTSLSAGCVRWFSSNAKLFLEIAERPNGHQQSPRRVSGYKILGEVGLMLMACGRSGKLASSGDFQEILYAFDAAVGKIRFPTEDPSSSLRFLLGVTLALEVNGLNSDRFREASSRILRQDLLHVLDQTPWSIVSLTYFLDRCGIRHGLPSFEELYSWSILRSRPPLHFLSTHELYALSHLIFFLGDFGGNSAFFTRLPDHKSLSTYIDHVTAACLIEGDWDLMGEFLIGYECICVDQSPMRDFAWRQILQQQLPDGQIAVPRRIQKKNDHSGASQLDTFERHYHQTLVGIIASSLYAKRHD
ncbi:hypothetical protein PMI09_00816 [Rhizobium sp. CF122]|uniref:DUF6895 family protein n=1 Tax=Rhizobium sp. CF122 TaxID=1144312 RepID=UPI000271B9E4|nr:hypothetical protein [Rhizobium sp. CF122]EJL57841.1 hypothetical protein PMI09_00816 [Rhizobium sp. CF122]